MNNIDTVYPYCQLPLLHCLPLARADTNAITIVHFFHISLRFICFHIFPTHPLPFLQHFHYHSLIVLIFGILPLITFNFHTVFQLIFFARTASCKLRESDPVSDRATGRANATASARAWTWAHFARPTYKTHHSSALSVFRKTFPTLLNYEHTLKRRSTENCTWRGYVDTPSPSLSLSLCPSLRSSFPFRNPQIRDWLLNYSKHCTQKFGVGRAPG